MRKIIISITIGAILLFTIGSCKHEAIAPVVDTTPQPGPVMNNAVCFQNDILPMFQSNCAKSGCHDAATHTKELTLESYTTIMKRDIVPGNADASKIYRSLFASGKDKMPALPNTDLTIVQKAIIGQWINEGAKNTVNCASNCDSNQFKFAANISPLLNTFCTGCHSGFVASGNIDLSNYNNVKMQVTNGWLIGAVTHTAGYVAMPKEANKLSDCQITQINKWVNASALNN